MDPWVYPRERTLGTITLVLGLLAWLLIIVGTFGLALVYVLLAFLVYVFAQSAAIAWIKGTAVRLSPTQFPDLHARFEACCRTLGIDTPPEVYLLNGSGALNAFATRFFGRNFVVLLSDVVDAMDDRPDGVNFYIGHELGHIRMKHLTGRLWRLPVLWLPLLGAAYARAQESTCDLHGRACCPDPETAARALVALAAGPRRWAGADLASYAAQTHDNRGFWPSFHELIGGYPWLTKRVARLWAPGFEAPRRNPFAYVLAFFVPYGGRAGGGAAGALITVAIIGVLAAIALPAYQDYTKRAAASQAWLMGAPIRDGLAAYYAGREEIPDSLSAASLPEQLPDGTPLELDTDSMTVMAHTARGTLLMVPRAEGTGAQGIRWSCEAGLGMSEAALPRSCRDSD